MVQVKTKSEKTAKVTHPRDGLVFQLKVTLMDSRPPIWRRILVPSTYTFFELHVALQDAMGWYGGHLHQFLTENPFKRNARPEYISYPQPDEDSWGEETLDERKIVLTDYLRKEKDIVYYEYDFGDGWMHEVKLEKIIPREQGAKYPTLVDGASATPPEDCGGVGGYYHLLDILNDPKHKEHNDMIEWLGIEDPKEFDPKHFDPKDVQFQDPKKVSGVIA